MQGLDIADDSAFPQADILLGQLLMAIFSFLVGMARDIRVVDGMVCFPRIKDW
ncbi:hypothetical protein D1AOALGA4SA_12177 [Olavius algarvensis Delta 1 endosymbiont]|nr:hypothetical protein D1AOALGA4SA_12177 [Olavius algarvensis Delta 1 endosymbiont]